ncbi:10333_t:CDS:1 [Acaulospora morrowiae]|uniref:10333_t:CDS:1 n=1 Tax=Acaulospora morrowiae TaxID=94023 RepID=A0A9N9FGX2_9GLOM|nr:10333_t:CDS:1 [Acaulospora morrowiae]
MLTINLEQWERLPVPDLSILKKTTVDILKYFNKCEETPEQIEYVIEQGQTFRSLTILRATECQKMASYADDMISYFEHLSGERESISSLMRPLEDLLSEAQNRKDSAEKLKCSINSDLKKVDLRDRSSDDRFLQVKSWSAKLIHIVLLVAIVIMLYITNIATLILPSTATESSEIKMEPVTTTIFYTTVSYEPSSYWYYFYTEQTLTITTSRLEIISADTTENSEQTATTTTADQTDATEKSEQTDAHWTWIYIPRWLSNDNSVDKATDTTTPHQMHVIQEHKSAINLFLTVVFAFTLGNFLSSGSNYQDNIVQALKSENKKLKGYVDAIDAKLPIIEENTTTLIKFWEQQVNNINNLIQALNSVDAKERIQFPPEVCRTIIGEWKEQREYCENFYKEIKRICR